VLLVGSIAHGFSTERSDVDVIVVTSSDDIARRESGRTNTVYLPDATDAPHGAVDVKYVDERFIGAAAQRGSEPARFAFDGARVEWSRVDGIARLVESASAYPVDGVDQRMARFRGQL